METPTSRKINSVIDKISLKLDNSGGRDNLNENDSLLSNENESDYLGSISRRNKRKARVPQQLTPQIENANIVSNEVCIILKK